MHTEGGKSQGVVMVLAHGIRSASNIALGREVGQLRTTMAILDMHEQRSEHLTIIIISLL